MRALKHIAIASTLAIASIGVFAQSAIDPTPQIDQRAAEQGKRIDDAANKGELTPRQATRLAKQQRKIDKAQAKAQADGVVTPKEEAKLTKMQDKANASIEKKKADVAPAQ